MITAALIASMSALHISLNAGSLYASRMNLYNSNKYKINNDLDNDKDEDNYLRDTYLFGYLSASINEDKARHANTYFDKYSTVVLHAAESFASELGDSNLYDNVKKYIDYENKRVKTNALHQLSIASVRLNDSTCTHIEEYACGITYILAELLGYDTDTIEKRALENSLLREINYSEELSYQYTANCVQCATLILATMKEGALANGF